jgi:hypothetical protein
MEIVKTRGERQMSKHRETGHMVERAPGRWAIVISVKDATTGKRKRQWHSFQGTKQEAKQERIRLLAALNNGMPPRSERRASASRPLAAPAIQPGRRRKAAEGRAAQADNL